MSLKDTIQKLSLAFAAKPQIVLDKAQMERDRIAAEKLRYEKFTETTLLTALDELNSIPGLHVQRLYTKVGNMYSVKYDFLLDKKVKILFSVIPDPQRPIHMEVNYVYDMGTVKQKKYDTVLSVDDSVQKIIDIFELGITKCGPRI